MSLQLDDIEVALLKACVPMIRNSLGGDNSPFENIEDWSEDDIERAEFQLIDVLNKIIEHLRPRRG